MNSQIANRTIGATTGIAMLNELIQVTEREGIETVDARALHSFLEVGRDFTTWIKQRIEKYQFKESFDFVITEDLSSPKRVSAKSRQQIVKSYHITIDIAKELSMVENNEKGREARQYFIAREKQARAISGQKLEGPLLLASAVKETDRLLQSMSEENQALRIKAEVADQIAESEGLFHPSVAGKIINGHPNQFCAWLVNKEILFRRGKSLVPFQRFIDREYFKVKTYSLTVEDTRTGEKKRKASSQTYLTARGLAWASAKYSQDAGILNLPEPMGVVR